VDLDARVVVELSLSTHRGQMDAVEATLLVQHAIRTVPMVAAAHLMGMFYHRWSPLPYAVLLC
jgi:hypothetical protein